MGRMECNFAVAKNTKCITSVCTFCSNMKIIRNRSQFSWTRYNRRMRNMSLTEDNQLHMTLLRVTNHSDNLQEKRVFSIYYRKAEKPSIKSGPDATTFYFVLYAQTNGINTLQYLSIHTVTFSCRVLCPDQWNYDRVGVIKWLLLPLILLKE